MANVDVEKQWEELTETIKKYIKSPRQKALIAMYEKLADRILTAPASSHSTRHNCYPGGYIDHVNRVVKVALSVYENWKELGANVSTFTVEELVFAAINHDLGKVGSMTDDYYVPNDSDWHVKRGQIYKINPKLQFMKVPDRSIYLLQENGISFSENEYLAIKLHDGLYSKGNESYLMAGLPEFSLKTDMPILLHHADHLSTLIEAALHNKPIEVVVSTPKTKSTKLQNINNPAQDSRLKDVFSEMFES